MVAPGSALLQDLLDHAPPDHFTLEWVAGLQRQSVGAVVFLFLLAVRMLSVAMVAGGYLEDDGLIVVIGVAASVVVVLGLDAALLWHVAQGLA